MNSDENEQKEVSATETSLPRIPQDEQGRLTMLGFIPCLKPVIWLRDLGDHGPTLPTADKTDT